MKTAICFLLCWLPAYLLHAQPIVWNSAESVNDITRRLSVLEDATHQLTIQQINSPDYQSQFHRSDQSILHFGLTESVYWLRFDLSNGTDADLFLQLEQAFIPKADLYYQNQAGKWTVLRSGYRIPIADKLVKDHFQTFPLPKGAHRFYIRLLPYVHPIPVKLWDRRAYEVNSNKEKVAYGVYLGILLFAITLHLFLYVTLRFTYYLLYSLLIFSYLIASLGVLEGYIIYLFPGINLLYTYTILPVWTMPVLLVYCLVFLETKKVNPKLYYATIAACSGLAVYLIALHVFPLLTVWRTTYILITLGFLLTCYIGIDAGRKGNRLGYYYTFTYGVWFVLLVMELSNILIGSPPHILQFSYVSLAMLIESFLLALLLAKRFQWNRQEEERARFVLQRNLLEMQQRFDREMLQTRLEIQEQTFDNISQDIHDNIGQTLSVVNLYLRTVTVGPDEDDNRRIEQSIQLVADVIAHLRNIAHSLNADYLKKLGLVRAIQQQVSMLQKTGAVTVRLSTDGTIQIDDHNKQLILFRIVQELLNNTLKHAEATHIQVNVQRTGTELRIEVLDNGKGFDKTAIQSPESNTGMGLNTIQNRLELIDGTFTIDSQLHEGTKVLVIVPV